MHNQISFFESYIVYKIMAVMKVETDSIARITVSLIGWAVILVIMYIKTFKTNIIVFVGNVVMFLLSHWPIMFTVMVGSLILTESKENVQITDK